MNAKEAVQLVVEGAPPKDWAASLGIYANYSNWPQEVQWYGKCPVCGKVNGSYKTMKEAHDRRTCNQCQLDSVNKVKGQVSQVIAEPEKKVKPMVSLVGEAVVPEPPEENGLPEPSPSMADVNRYVLGNWVDQAVNEIVAKEGLAPGSYEIDEDWSMRHGSYDPDPEYKGDTEIFRIDTDAKGRFIVFKTLDIAKAYAVERAKDQLQSDPGVFDFDWVWQYIDVDKLNRTLAADVANIEEIGARDYLEELYGKAKAVEEAVNLVGINAKDAAKDAVDETGWSFFIGQHGLTLENDAVYCEL